ncbi:MAG: hypothetical protein GF408_07460 [Candidatus Omnitrophica bacterium]|nr:hypothetical protein [Candidatus Omnitrophota bacterium]
MKATGKKQTMFRIIRVLVAAAFVVNFVMSDAWAAISGMRPPGEELPQAPAMAELKAGTFTLPSHLGTVKYSRDLGGEKVVVHIQDAHCNYAAQRSVAGIIEFLRKEYGVSLVNMEGGSGGYDLSAFTEIEDDGVREEVADRFVAGGMVNGPEVYAINHPGAIELWGVEKGELYLENLKVYRDTRGYMPAVNEYIDGIAGLLTALKDNIFSKELLLFDEKYTAYKTGSLDFREYLIFLLDRARRQGINIKEFSNIYLLSQAMEQEDEIDFKRANTEREKLIKHLRDILSMNEIKELVSRTVEFRNKWISESEFYEFLIKKAKQSRISLKEYPELRKYVIYISIYNAADKAMVMEELEDIESLVKEDHYDNDKQRTLDRLSKNLVLTRNIFEMRFTKPDYNYYLENREDFAVENYISFIGEEKGAYGIGLALPEGVEDLDGFREEVFRFYELSFLRDEEFLKRMKFPEGEVKVSVLVTGGFHAQNLCELFEDEGISFVSIMPNFRNKEGYECPYFRILGGHTTGVLEAIRAGLPQASLMQIYSVLSASEDISSKVYGEGIADAMRLAVRAVREEVEKGTALSEARISGSDLILSFSDGSEETIDISSVVGAPEKVVDIAGIIREGYDDVRGRIDAGTDSSAVGAEEMKRVIDEFFFVSKDPVRERPDGPGADAEVWVVHITDFHPENGRISSPMEATEGIFPRPLVNTTLNHPVGSVNMTDDWRKGKHAVLMKVTDRFKENNPFSGGEQADYQFRGGIELSGVEGEDWVVLSSDGSRQEVADLLAKEIGDDVKNISTAEYWTRLRQIAGEEGGDIGSEITRVMFEVASSENGEFAGSAEDLHEKVMGRMRAWNAAADFLRERGVFAAPESGFWERSPEAKSLIGPEDAGLAEEITTRLVVFLREYLLEGTAGLQAGGLAGHMERSILEFVQDQHNIDIERVNAEEGYLQDIVEQYAEDIMFGFPDMEAETAAEKAEEQVSSIVQDAEFLMGFYRQKEDIILAKLLVLFLEEGYGESDLEALMERYNVPESSREEMKANVRAVYAEIRGQMEGFAARIAEVLAEGGIAPDDADGVGDAIFTVTGEKGLVSRHYPVFLYFDSANPEQMKVMKELINKKYSQIISERDSAGRAASEEGVRYSKVGEGLLISSLFMGIGAMFGSIYGLAIVGAIPGMIVFAKTLASTYDAYKGAGLAGDWEISNTEETHTDRRQRLGLFGALAADRHEASHGIFGPVISAISNTIGDWAFAFGAPAFTGSLLLLGLNLAYPAMSMGGVSIAGFILGATILTSIGFTLMHWSNPKLGEWLRGKTEESLVLAADTFRTVGALINYLAVALSTSLTVLGARGVSPGTKYRIMRTLMSPLKDPESRLKVGVQVVNNILGEEAYQPYQIDAIRRLVERTPLYRSLGEYGVSAEYNYGTAKKGGPVRDLSAEIKEAFRNEEQGTSPRARQALRSQPKTARAGVTYKGIAPGLKSLLVNNFNMDPGTYDSMAGFIEEAVFRYGPLFFMQAVTGLPALSPWIFLPWAVISTAVFVGLHPGKGAKIAPGAISAAAVLGTLLTMGVAGWGITGAYLAAALSHTLVNEMVDIFVGRRLAALLREKGFEGVMSAGQSSGPYSMDRVAAYRAAEGLLERIVATRDPVLLAQFAEEVPLAFWRESDRGNMLAEVLPVILKPAQDAGNESLIDAVAEKVQAGIARSEGSPGENLYFRGILSSIVHLEMVQRELMGTRRGLEMMAASIPDADPGEVIGNLRDVDWHFTEPGVMQEWVPFITRGAYRSTGDMTGVMERELSRELVNAILERLDVIRTASMSGDRSMDGEANMIIRSLLEDIRSVEALAVFDREGALADIIASMALDGVFTGSSSVFTFVQNGVRYSRSGDITSSYALDLSGKFIGATLAAGDSQAINRMGIDFMTRIDPLRWASADRASGQMRTVLSGLELDGSETKLSEKVPEIILEALDSNAGEYAAGIMRSYRESLKKAGPAERQVMFRDLVMGLAAEDILAASGDKNYGADFREWFNAVVSENLLEGPMSEMSISALANKINRLRKDSGTRETASALADMVGRSVEAYYREAERNEKKGDLLIARDNDLMAERMLLTLLLRLEPEYWEGENLLNAINGMDISQSSSARFLDDLRYILGHAIELSGDSVYGEEKKKFSVAVTRMILESIDNNLERREEAFNAAGEHMRRERGHRAEREIALGIDDREAAEAHLRMAEQEEALARKSLAEARNSMDLALELFKVISSWNAYMQSTAETDPDGEPVMNVKVTFKVTPGATEILPLADSGYSVEDPSTIQDSILAGIFARLLRKDLVDIEKWTGGEESDEAKEKAGEEVRRDVNAAAQMVGLMSFDSQMFGYFSEVSRMAILPNSDNFRNEKGQIMDKSVLPLSNMLNRLKVYVGRAMNERFEEDKLVMEALGPDTPAETEPSGGPASSRRIKKAESAEAARGRGLIGSFSREGTGRVRAERDADSVRFNRVEDSVRVDSVVLAIAREEGEGGSPRNRVITAEEALSSVEAFLEEKGEDATEAEKSFVEGLIRDFTENADEIVVLEDNEDVMGFFDPDSRTMYISENLLGNPLVFLHELGENADMPEGFPAMTAHTYMRGAGSDARRAFYSMDPRGTGSMDSVSFKDALNARMSEMGFRRLTESEMALIDYNALQGRKGIALLYGIQDHIDPGANIAFSSQIKAMTNDMRRGVMNYILIPSFNIETMNGQEKYSRQASRKFRRMGVDTAVLHYDEMTTLKDQLKKAWLLSLEKEAMLPKIFVDCLTDEQMAEVEEFIGGLPDDDRERARKMIVTGNDRLPDDGKDIDEVMVNEVKIITIANGILNDKRLREDFRLAPEELIESRRRMLGVFKSSGIIDLGTEVSAMSAQDLEDVMQKLYTGKMALRITQVDWQDIQDWYDANEEVMRSL